MIVTIHEWVNIIMKSTQLIEAAESDLRQVDQARSISKKFLNHLARYEDRTLLATPGAYEARVGGYHGVFFDAQAILKEFPDLSFGFVTTARGADVKAVLLRSAPGHRPRYWACFVVDKNPADAIDIAFSVSWNNMVHELTHYLDYKRGYDRDGAPTGQREKEVNALKKRMTYSYYNDPLELNAYYSMAVADIIDRMKAEMRRDGQRAYYDRVLRSFDAFKSEFLYEFRSDWVRHLNTANRKRFEKRLYLLWKHLSDNLMPADKAAK